MSMTSLNVSLPKPLKDYVATHVQRGGYSTPSEYVRALIREEQRREGKARMESLLLEGIGSGEPIEVDKTYWKKKRRLLSARLKKPAHP
jgi:antitoxin ParD1/3/4